MEGAGAGSSAGGVVGGAGSVCGEGGDRDVVYKGELSNGLGEEEGGEEGEGQGQGVKVGFGRLRGGGWLVGRLLRRLGEDGAIRADPRVRREANGRSMQEF